MNSALHDAETHVHGILTGFYFLIPGTYRCSTSLLLLLFYCYFVLVNNSLLIVFAYVKVVRHNL